MYWTTIDATVGGGGVPSEYCHAVWSEKYLNGLATRGENFFKDMFILFDRIHERDRHTNTRASISIMPGLSRFSD